MKKDIVEHMDNLIEYCGYFNCDTELNNGYGCDHPENEDTEYCDIMEREQGKCFSFSCPIAYEIVLDNDEDVEIMKKKVVEDYGKDYLIKQYGFGEEISKHDLVNFYGSEETDYMLIHDEEILKKINGGN